MEKCKCNENCFFYTKSIITYKNNANYHQKILVNKCNRLVGDNIKKKPCDFLSNKILSEKIIEENKPNNTKEKYNKKNDKQLTYNDIRNELKQLMEWYYKPKTNLFGKINYYLKILGYDVHEPTMESLSELEYRISKPPKKIKNKIYVNNSSYFSKSIGEYDYDYDEELYISNNIKNKHDPFEWLKVDYIKELLKPTKTSNKLSKSINKKKQKSYKNKIVTSRYGLLNKYENYEIVSEEKQVNYKLEPDDDKEYQNDHEDSDEDSDEEDNQEESDKDNEFDVENYSDEEEDYDENDYEDFSD